jgi:hypothetical protein
VDPTYLVLLSDISGETGHVCRTFLAAMFDDCFERNFLTVSLIDLILLPLDS